MLFLKKKDAMKTKKIVLLFFSFLLIYSCSSSSDGNDNPTAVVPTLTTTVVSSIATVTAVSGGTISSDGGAAITARGVCWSTSSNPTITLSTKTTDGSGTGVFPSNISGLIPNTTYYVRAYASNSVGTAYGNELSFTTSGNSGTTATDIDGNVYELVTICDQTWMTTNLNVSHYRNGDVIPQVTDATQWAALTSGAWCYYANTSANGTIYGKLYNWYAVNDPRGLAPVGYHIPSDSEWTTLTTCLGGEFVAGGKLKETGITHWAGSNIGATNTSGFTGLPGGCRGGNTIFSQVGLYGYWWSSSAYQTNYAWIYYLYYDNANTNRSTDGKIYGHSVRCLMD